jgi:DNA-directed RNA polymerase subunit RPC12/RpoP
LRNKHADNTGGCTLMFTRCPGAISVVEPIPEPVICPHCRMEVEMFTNETSLRCYHCGGLIVRDKKPSCFDWCEYADRCAKELGIRLDD